MSWEVPGKMIGQLAADVDMSNVGTWQNTAVSVATAANIVGHGVGNAALKAMGTGVFFGVLQNAPVQGEPGNVMVDGVTKWRAGGSFAVGDSVTADSSGKVIKAATGAKVYGIALEQAVSGDITTVLLRVNGVAA